MKKNEKLEMKNMSLEALKEKVDAYRRDLFSIRLHAVTKPVKDTDTVRKLRKAIACTLTFINQKQTQE
jgi:ribosomal protein L29